VRHMNMARSMFGQCDATCSRLSTGERPRLHSAIGWSRGLPATGRADSRLCAAQSGPDERTPPHIQCSVS
jgi:hypothetical protein